MREDGTTLLLGAGYTLCKVAEALGRDRAVLTTTSPDKARALRSAGWRVEVLSLPDEIGLSAIVGERGIDFVVDGVPPVSLPDGAPDAGALERHFRAMKGARFRRAIYLSTSGVFGVEDGSWVDERTPAAPKHPRSLGRLAYEEGYRALPAAVSVIRVPAIYGPGRGLSQSLRRGSFRMVEGGARYSNRVHVDDLASLVVALLRIEEPPALVAAGDDEPAPISDVVAHYSSLLGSGRVESVSLEEARRLGLHTLTGNQRIRNRLMKEILGAPLRYPSYREGALSEIAAS